MRRDEVVEALQATPFRPFRLYVSDGGAFVIHHPEMLMETRHSAIVGIAESGENGDSTQDYPAMDRSTIVDLLQITRIEELERRPT